MGETEAKNENLHGDELREKKRHQIAKSERDVVDRILDQSFSRLVTGDVPEPVPEGLVAFIFETACAGVTGNALRIRHNHLVRRLDEIAGEHGFEIPNRDLMIVVRMDTPPMTPRSFAHKSVYEVIEADFWNSLRSDGVNGSRRLTHDAGRLVYSMIWFGGLHSQKFLKTICGAITGGLQTAKRYRGDKQLYWLESTESSECSRWFPDPVTLMLLHRFNREHGLKAFPANAPSFLAGFVSRISSRTSAVSADRNFVRSLMDAASTVASLNMMGCAHFAQNASGVSVSLGANSWTRLITGLVPPRSSISSPKPDSALTATQPFCRLYGTKNGNVSDAIASIHQALALDERKKSASAKSASYKALRGIAESSPLSPIVGVIASWCAFSRLSVTASSIRRYLSEFAEPLIAELIDEEDLNDLDEDDWEELYAELLKASSSIQQRAYRSGVLRRFHHYLVTQHGLPDTYIEGVSSNGQVDAEILTPAEFGRTLSLLADEPDRRLSEARQVALILGYRGGLRRGEIRRLLLRDLQGLYEPALAFPTLIVRGNRFGATKTVNANRVLPLWALLTDSELDLVRRWYRRRVLEQPSIKRNQLVFCELHQPDSLMPAGTLIDPIQDAMRSASGTPILRFHHLRHSCATYSALRLMESYPGELFPVEWACSDDGEVIMPHWGEDWYAVLCGEDRYVPAFEKLQYLTFMMGHASPGQTIRTYTHLLDYAVGLMRWSVPMGTLSNVCQAELLGFTEDNLQQFRNRRGLSKNKESTPAQLAAVLGRFKKDGEIGVDKSFTKFEMPASAGRRVPESSQMPASVFLVYRALDHISQLTRNGAIIEKAIVGTADLFGVSEPCLTRCHRRGEWLMDRHARDFKEEHPGQRNAFTLFERPDADSISHRVGVGGVDNPVQRTCPAPPKLAASHPTVEKMYQSLVNLADSDAERFVALVENVVDAVQRSHTQIKFPSTERKVLYLKFLEVIGFLKLAWVDVRAPENGTDRQQMKAYWSKELSLPESRVRVRWDEPAGPRNAMGVAQIVVDQPTKGFGGRSLQHGMTAVRFVAFVALIGFAGRVYVDEKIQKERAIHGR
ncbi:site-specific integrase [Marinobacter salsuginis]|uniref:site-specific integrase n=1 Tax=Marinobacter salsuginis TaxID=418719 RepID=UPI001AE09142|nr:site-specific integrase [Marinobacter salsuginis]QTN42155.1 site-specific integrase [Marinobacter salsuginis]